MLPKIIHQIWVGPNQIPPNFLKLRDKLIDLHPDWTTLLWTDNNVGELCEKHVFQHSTYAGQSNVIRLYALKKYGGIYLDLDFDVLKTFDELLEYNDFVARQPDGVFCNAFIGAQPDSKWINQMIENYGDHQVKDASWGCHIIKDYIGQDVNILPTDYFYPYNWDAEPLPPTDNTVAIHLWEGSWIAK